MKFEFYTVISLVLPTIILAVGSSAQTGKPWAGQILSESINKSLSASPNLAKSEILTPAKFDVSIPFSFVYDGKRSSELLPGWQHSEQKSDLPHGRQVRSVEIQQVS